MTGCNHEQKKAIKEEVVSFSREGALEIYHEGQPIGSRMDIEFAESEFETQTGLMYRTSLKSTEGMLFIFPTEEPRYFYMKNTEIALDIIYIGADQKIVSILKNAKPLDETSLPSQLPAKYVLEVNAGLSDQWNIQVGDSISYRKD